MSLKLLNKIDMRTKYSVYGWIRNKRQLLKLQTIPSMIQAICILYYKDDEVFDIINDKIIKLSENKKIITRFYMNPKETNHVDNNTSYGMLEIPSNSEAICKWDLKILMANTSDHIFIGVTHKHNKNKNICMPGDEIKDNPYYVYGNSSWCKGFKRKLLIVNKGPFWQNGDKVSIVLDLKHAEMKLEINGIVCGNIFKNIVKSATVTYRLFVAIRDVGAGVEIVDFTKK